MTHASVNPALFQFRAFKREWDAALSLANRGCDALRDLLLVEGHQWIRLGRSLAMFAEDDSRMLQAPALTSDGVAALADWIQETEVPAEIDAAYFGRCLANAVEQLTAERAELLRLVLFADDDEWSERVGEAQRLVIQLRENHGLEDFEMSELAWALKDAPGSAGTLADPGEYQLPAGWRLDPLSVMSGLAPSTDERVASLSSVRSSFESAIRLRESRNVAAVSTSGISGLDRGGMDAPWPLPETADPLVVAEALLSDHKLDEAEAFLRSVSSPEKAGLVASHMGQIAVLRGDLGAAVDWFERAIASGVTDALLLLGMVRVQQRDDPAAAEALSLLEKSGNGRAAFPLATVLADIDGRESEALAAFRRAWQAGVREAAVPLARLLETQGSVKDARAILVNAARSGDGSASFALGRSYRAAGEYEQAVDSFMAADAKGVSGSAFMLGLVRAAQGNLESAEDWYSKATAEGDDRAWLNLGNVRRRADDLPGAEQAYRRAVRSGDVGAYLELAATYVLLDDHAEAEAMYRKAVDTGDPNAPRALGRLLAQSDERLSEAKEFLEMSLSSGQVESLLDLGLLAAREGRMTDAESLLTEADDLGLPRASAILGEFFAGLGRIGSARAAYERGARMEDPACLHNLGVLLSDGGSWDDARPYFEKAADLGSAPAANNMALILSWLGDDAGAELWWRRAIARGDMGAATNLAGVLLERGDRSSARELYAAAATNGVPVANLGLARLAHEDGDESTEQLALEYAERSGVTETSGILGRFFERRGDLAEAEAAYRRGTAARDLEARFSLALLLEATDRLEQAEEVLADLVRTLEERDTQPATSAGPLQQAASARLGGAPRLSLGRAQAVWGLMRARKGDHAAALELFRAAAEAGVPEATFNVAQVHSALGDSDAEWEWLSRASAAGQSDAYVNMAVAYRRQGDLANAEGALRRAHEAGNLRATSDLGLLLHDVGRLGEAEQLLREAVAQTADDADVVNLARVLERRNEHADAIALLRPIAATVPQAAHNLGVLLDLEGQVTEAIDAYRLAIAGGHLAAESNLGAIFLEQGDFGRAEAMLSASTLSQNPTAVANLGALYFHQGRYGEAAAHFMRAIDLGATECRVSLARAQRSAGHLPEAIATAQRAVGEGVTGAGLVLGSLYEEMGDLALAADAYGQAVDDRNSAGFRLGYVLGRAEYVGAAADAAVVRLDETLELILRSGSAALDQIDQISSFAELTLSP